MARDSESHGLAQFGFREGHPEMWAPSFKLKKNKGKDKKKDDDQVGYTLQRTPSWVDRVLYMSNNKETKASPMLKGRQTTFREFSKPPTKTLDKNDLDIDSIDTLTCVNQDSNNLLMLSDHKPVFSQFYLKLNNFYNKQPNVYGAGQGQARGRE